jgi:DNA-directed RNA polymerase specialized sigma24 family protein
MHLLHEVGRDAIVRGRQHDVGTVRCCISERTINAEPSQPRRWIICHVGGGRTLEPGRDPTGHVAVDALVRTLPDERREAFVLTQLLGLSYAEAARVCSCPVGTIRSRVARARADLIVGLGGRAAAEI